MPSEMKKIGMFDRVGFHFNIYLCPDDIGKRRNERKQTFENQVKTKNSNQLII